MAPSSREGRRANPITPIDAARTGLDAAERRVDAVVTIVVPTRNEADNVAPLLERIGAALADWSHEVLFVDDSDDDTPVRIAEAAVRAPVRNIRLLHRGKPDRTGGLGGAVVAGFRMAEAPWLIVMDGDLQHPPEVLPLLLERATETEADVVVASRYRAGGDGSALGSARLRISSSAGRAARALFPRRLDVVTDPMSGFFLVRADAVELDRLRPDGFKILIEILLRGRQLRVAEVGYTFAERHAGSSKASVREGTKYVGRLVELRWQAFRGPKAA